MTAFDFGFFVGNFGIEWDSVGILGMEIALALFFIFLGSAF